MVEQCRQYLAFHDWTFGYDGIAGYYEKVIDEEWRYGDIQKHDVMHLVEDYGNAVKAIGKKKLLQIQDHMFKSTKNKSKLVPAINFVFGTFPLSKAHGWAISQHQDSYSMMYAALSDPINRTPGECVETVTGLFSKRSPLKELGYTNEWIHPSVYWRTKNSEHVKDDNWKYQSTALMGFKRAQDADGAWGYRKGNIWLPEWHIQPVENPEENAEWLVIDSCADREEAKAFLIKAHMDWKKAQENSTKRQLSIRI